MPVSKETIDGLPILSNETTEDGLPILKKKVNTTGTTETSLISSPESGSGIPSTSNKNPFEFTLNETPSDSTPLPNAKDILIRQPVNYELGTPNVPKPPTKSDVITETVSAPEYKKLTTSEKKNLINAKLLEKGLTTPELIAHEDALKEERRKFIEEESVKDGKRIQDFETKKTVYHNGRNYEDSPIYHLGDFDYTVLGDGTKLKFVGDEWIQINSEGSPTYNKEESDQLDNIDEKKQNEFKESPQNLTANLFNGQDEYTYQNKVNKYLFQLQESDPNEYDVIARKVLETRGDNSSLSSQQLKRSLLYLADKESTEDKRKDFSILVDRVGGLNKIKEYNTLREIIFSNKTTPEQKAQAQQTLNTNYSPEQLQTIADLRVSYDEIKNADDEIKNAENTFVKDAVNEENNQRAYEVASAMSKISGGVNPYLISDVGKTVLNTVEGTAASLLQIPKTFDTDNKYDYLDKYSDRVSELTEDMRLRTADRKVFSPDNGVDASAAFPLIAGALTNMAILGGGARALSGAVGYNAGIVTSGFILTRNDYYQEAKNNGLSDQEANAFATGAAALTSTLELVSPGEKIWGEAGLAKVSIKEAMERFSKGETLGSVFQALKPYAREIRDENLQEISQGVGDVLSKGIANTIIGRDELDTQYKMEEFVETVIATTFATAIAGGLRGVVTQDDTRKEYINKLTENGHLFDVALNTIEANVNSGLISKEKGLDLSLQLTERFNEKKQMPIEWSDSKKSYIADFSQQLNPIQEAKYEIADNGEIIEKQPSPAQIKSEEANQSKLSDLQNTPNEWFDNLSKTRGQKVAEIQSGNSAPIEAILSEEATPEEKAAQINDLKEAVAEVKPEEEKTGEISGVAYTYPNPENTSDTGSIYLADEEVAKSFADGSGPVEKFNYTLKKPYIVKEDADFDAINKIISDYREENPDAKFHPDITDKVNQELEKLGHDGLVIKKEALETDKGYNEIGGTYGEPQIVVFDKKNTSRETDQPKVDFTGKDNNFLANKEPGFFTPEERIQYNELMKMPETESEAAKMVADKKIELKNAIINPQISSTNEQAKTNREATNQEPLSTEEGQPEKTINATEEEILAPKIKSSFDSNIEALIDPKTGLASVMRKALEQQKPYKAAFMKRIGLSMEDYEQLDETGKQEIQDTWVKSPEFEQLNNSIENESKGSDNNRQINSGNEINNEKNNNGGIEANVNSNILSGKKVSSEQSREVKQEKVESGNEPPSPPNKTKEDEGSGPPNDPLKEIREFKGIFGEEVSRDNYYTYINRAGIVDSPSTKEKFEQQMSQVKMNNMVSKFLISGGKINDLAQLLGDEKTNQLTKALIITSIEEMVPLGLVKKSVSDTIYARYSKDLKSHISNVLNAFRSSGTPVISPQEMSLIYSAIGKDFEEELDRLNEVLDQINNGTKQPDGSVQVFNDEELQLNKEQIESLIAQIEILREELAASVPAKPEKVSSKRQRVSKEKLTLIKSNMENKYGKDYVNKLKKEIEKISNKC